METDSGEGGGESVESSEPVGPGNYPAVDTSDPYAEDVAPVAAEEEPEGAEDTDEEDGEEGRSELDALEAALDGDEPPEEAGPAELTPEQIDALETTITVRGKEQTKTIAELKKDAELGLGAYEKMEEAAKERKQVKQLFASLQTAKTPQLAQFLRRLGHDPVQFAVELGADVLRREDMTPEQREREDFRAEREEYERKRQADAEQQRQAQIAARMPVEQERIHGEYVASMDKMGVPASDKVREGLIMRAADRQLRAVRAGVQMPSEHAVALEWEALQAIAGQQTEAMRKQRLAKATSAPVKKAPKSAKKSPKKPHYTTYPAGSLEAWQAALEAD